MAPQAAAVGAGGGGRSRGGCKDEEEWAGRNETEERGVVSQGLLVNDR